ncbi:MAG: hypothetical protein Q8M65_06000 [Rhodoglobus sp.]|nr:hypothetical protein [Rhodoglobus sp.]
MALSTNEKVHAIIHSASTAAGLAAAGLAQLPCSDNAVLVPIQISMIIAIGAVHDIELDRSGAAALLATSATTMAGRAASQALLGWIPGLGNAINAATAAALTQAIGWTADATFRKGK